MTFINEEKNIEKALEWWIVKEMRRDTEKNNLIEENKKKTGIDKVIKHNELLTKV